MVYGLLEPCSLSQTQAPEQGFAFWGLGVKGLMKVKTFFQWPAACESLSRSRVSYAWLSVYSTWVATGATQLGASVGLSLQLPHCLSVGILFAFALLPHEMSSMCDPASKSLS